MMNTFKFFSLIFFVSYLAIFQAHGQDVCIPSGVTNITISYGGVVSWDPNPNEKCSINYYLVYVDSSVGTEYMYAVSGKTLDVSFLPVCDSYIFRVVAISSQNVEGEEVYLDTKIPLPADANLTVAIVRVSQENSHNLYIEWAMDDEWVKCADRFRVIIDDQEIDHFQDIYTFNTSLSITDMAPCTSYEVGVVAIYNWAIEGPVTVVQHSTPEAVQTPPRFNAITLGATSATLSWNLETYARNKCPVTQALVNVVNTYNTTVDILDQTTRQPFNVTLTNLQADRLYIVNTTVVNSAGTSSPVVLAFQTLAN